MIIEIDDESKDPPYVQLRAGIMVAIANGTLDKGERLPSIRQVAGDLGLANNTVARAYRELEADGFVVSRGRRGTIVIDVPTPTEDQAVRQLIDDFVAESHRLGLSPAATLALVSESLAK